MNIYKKDLACLFISELKSLFIYWETYYIYWTTHYLLDFYANDLLKIWPNIFFFKMHSVRPCKYSRPWWAYIRGGIYTRSLYLGGKALQFASVKLTFLSFFQYKARILAFFTSPKIWNMFKVNNKDTRIRKVNNKVKNKDTVDIVLASLLLTLNTFHFLFHCFYCWLWSVNCRLWLLLVALTLCACWN